MGEKFSTRSLLGLGQTGGGLSRSRSRSNQRRKSMNSYLRGQYGGDQWSCQSCTLMPSQGSNSIVVQPLTGGLTTQSTNAAISAGATTNAGMTTTGNGITGASTMIGGSKKSNYKNRLRKYDLKKLQNLAKSKGIKITKKKNGKTVNISKDSLINKLCEHKHGR